MITIDDKMIVNSNCSNIIKEIITPTSAKIGTLL